MESAQNLPIDLYTAAALLEWQLEMGADEGILDAPLNRYHLPERAEPMPMARSSAPSRASAPNQIEARRDVERGDQPPARGPAPEIHRAPQGPDPVEAARTTAMKATSLETLRDLLEAFEHCEPKKGARNCIFGGGHPQARVLFLTEAPVREEDVAASMMTGHEGVMFDKMVSAIGLTRDPTDANRAVYLLPVLPWRPPGDRDMTSQEFAMMAPFIARHVEFVDPDVVVMMGNSACAMGLGRPLAQTSVTRVRGQWLTAFGKPALAMAHPRNLISTPAEKRNAWTDLLELRARLAI
ncbi:uracil-DNA glycosylase family protein [Albirhodobacter sp. R86504]|uniref:uracil-DNA glycosylase n=1 Tax=Albirhodobacter sp. R86504 TaxID=3093848 RepID=UPI00367033C9